MFITCLLLCPITLEIGSAIPLASRPKEEDNAAERPLFRPKGFTGNLTPYDLEKVFQENIKKKEAGKGYNYSSFLVKEFSEHYYPKAAFRWHKAGGSFRYVGARRKDESTVQQVFVSWQSFDDSISWGFFNAEVERNIKGDPFAIIADAEVANKIKKSLLDRKLIDDPKDATDVFSFRTRFFKTEQKSSGLKFPDKRLEKTKIGVSIKDKVYFFTAQGEEAP